MSVMYYNLPIKDTDWVEEEAIDELSEWAESVTQYSKGFVITVYNEAGEPSFYYPFAKPINGKLYAIKEAILIAGDSLWNDPLVEGSYLEAARNHLAHYYSRIGRIPPWGTFEFRSLEAQNRALFILEGPSRSGELRAGEKRFVIKNAEGELCYGPKVRG